MTCTRSCMLRLAHVHVSARMLWQRRAALPECKLTACDTVGQLLETIMSGGRRVLNAEMFGDYESYEGEETADEDFSPRHLKRLAST